MRSFLLTAFLLLLSVIRAQQDVQPTAEQIQAFRRNQYEIDKNHGGIGLQAATPKLGPGVQSRYPWYGVNILSDILEIKLLFGEVDKFRPKDPADIAYYTPTVVTDRSFMFSAGVNVPLNILNFGAQHTYNKVLRGHPTARGSFGWYRLGSGNSLQKSDIYFMDLGLGYRLRLPYASLEFNLDSYFGITSQAIPEYYRGIGIVPSLTLRFDALKGLLNPSMVSVAASQVTATNIRTETRRTGTTYNSNGSRTEYYTTTTTADIHVSNFNMGVQDIGPYAGIGPKVSFMSPRKKAFTNPGYLVGVVAEGRGGPLDLGITLEGGRVGLGSAIEGKPDNTYRKKLDRAKSVPVGSTGMVNLYTNVGIDVSQVFLIPFGIAMDKGEATSFLSATAGFNFGMHYAFNAQYDPGVTETYTGTPSHPEEVAEKFKNPTDVGFGYLGGFYFSVQVGAMAFKVTNYRYYNAPFASTSMMSIAYRFPIRR